MGNFQIYNQVTRIYQNCKIKNIEIPFYSLLVVLTSPLECLPINDTSGASKDEQSAVFELEKGLSDTKNVFLDPKVSEAILNQMEKILTKGKAGMVQEEIDFLAKCLVLFRNVLHISDNQSKE